MFGIKKISDFTESRKDNAVEKRVELHCHTKMSDMDGVSEVKDLVKRAHDWGHKAIAITDHGVVQAFPDANHYIETLDKTIHLKLFMVWKDIWSMICRMWQSMRKANL